VSVVFGAVIAEFEGFEPVDDEVVYENDERCDAAEASR